MHEKDVVVTSMGFGRWQVRIRDGAVTTHEVTIPEGYLEELGMSDAPPEAVVEESFRFLLEREPGTSILREFALPVIARYFPEYGQSLAGRIKV